MTTKPAERGLFVYSVEARGGRIGTLLRRRTGRQIGGSDFLILNQQFNTLIKAGLPILRALDLLATRASSSRLRPVVEQIRDQVREGKSLSEAVDEAGVFSKVYSTAILAGEKSGNLPGVLDYYIAYQDELGVLAGSFNTMTTQLRDSRPQIDESTRSLQQAVRELERRQLMETVEASAACRDSPSRTICVPRQR